MKSNLNKTTNPANKSELDNQGNTLNQTAIAEQTGKGDTHGHDNNQKVEFKDSKLKFYSHQFDNQQFWTGSKSEWKGLFENPQIAQTDLLLQAVKDKLTAQQKDNKDYSKYKLVDEENKTMLGKIDIVPQVDVELLSTEQLEKIQKKQNKTTAEIIEYFRMQQYRSRFNKDLDEPKEEDFEEDIEAPSEFQNTYDHVLGRANSLYNKVIGEKEVDKDKVQEEIDQTVAHKHGKGKGEKNDDDAPKEITTNVIPAPAFAKQQTLAKFKCLNEQHSKIINDLDFGDDKNQGQISDLISWKRDKFLIQKVFDKAGDLHLQIMKIPYINVHYTPNFGKKKMFRLTRNDCGETNFHDQGANPEGRIWIQYNQYIYFYTVLNLWNGGENNKFQLTRQCYDLENEVLTLDKQFNEIKEENMTLSNYIDDPAVSDDTKVFGARCVIFSTPMEAPELDDKGKMIKKSQDLIIIRPDVQKSREEWVKSHFILIQSACETQSKEKWHTGRICQQNDDLHTLGYVVAYKPRQSLSFNLCHWKKGALGGKANNKIPLASGSQGILQVLTNDSGDAVPLEQLEIFQQEGQSAKAKNKNYEMKLSHLKWDHMSRLKDQAIEVYDGQYQKVYTKMVTKEKDEFTVEMMSHRTDPFKYKMAAEIGVISAAGCMNYRNNIIMIYHKDFNYYQVLANEHGKTNFSSVISNKSEDNHIIHEPFSFENASFMQKLHSLYGEGFKQFHEFYINILVSHEGKLVVVKENGDILHDTVQICLNDELNKNMHMYQEKHDHGEDGNQVKKTLDSQYHLEMDDQRRFQPHEDDRTVWVGVKYVGTNNQYVYLQVIQNGKNPKVLIEKIGAFDFKGDANRKFNTAFVPSSAVEQVCCDHDNLFTQTYSLALMSPSKLFVEIMEYQLTWWENKDATSDNTTFTQIGRKILILNKHYKKKESVLGKKTPMNFIPHYNNLDKNRQDYYIEGTNLFRNEEGTDWNIIIPTFKKNDYQFDGQLCNTGFKKYFERDSEGNIQERALLIDTRLSTKLIKAKDDVLTPSQRNLIFEQQIRTMLNMWPKKDIIHSIQSYYTEENIDPFAGLEVVNCNSLADYLIAQPNLLDKALDKTDQEKSQIKTKSFIEDFGTHMNDEVLDKKRNEITQNYYEELVLAFPKELEWIRKPFCLADDLLMSNPLLKCFSGDMDSTIASVRLLISNVFDSGRSSVSYNRLIQILPEILDPNNQQYGFNEYGQFFSDYGEDGSMDNLTFAIKLIHEDLPKFSDKEAFMKQFELKKQHTNKDLPAQYYPNTDLREKAMEQIKDLDKIPVEKPRRFHRLRQLLPQFAEELVAGVDKEFHEVTDTIEDESTVKSIPVEHFLINLNFLAASKLINCFFEDSIEIDENGEKIVIEKKDKDNNSLTKHEGKDIQLKQGSGVSELQFVRMMKDINAKYKDGINEQQALQDVIDYTFFEKTEQFVKYKFTAYIILFTTPYLLQLLVPMPWYSVIFLCCVAEAWKLFEFYYEFIQFSVEGFKEYIDDISNTFDMIAFFSYNVYFAIRFFKTGTQFVGMNSQLDIDFWSVLNIFLNIVIVTNIIIQFLQYLQVAEKMGLLVQLVITCLWDIKEFMCFFLIWILFFGLLSKALGSDNDLGAYPNMDIYSQIFIQTWQNSIGNINPPSTTYWNNHQSNKDASIAHAANIAVYTIYLFWFANQFLILIVVINFLIAVISQSYENVMDTAVIIKYSQRCDLNSQISIIYEHSHVLKDNFDCVILSSNTSHGGDNEWSGFCQSVKGYVKEQNARVFSNISKANDQVQTTKDKIIANVKGARKNVKTAVSEVEKLLQDLKQQIKENPEASIQIEQSMIEQSTVEQ